MPQRKHLTSAFLSSAPKGALQGQHASREGLEAQLDAWVAAAQRRFPEVHVDSVVFIRYVAERLEASAGATEALASIKPADLYLACACAGGDEAAARIFDEVVVASARPALLTAGYEAHVDEVLQRVREKLLLRVPGRAAGVARYSGRGPLTAWTRAVALREAATLVRRPKKTRALEDELLELPARDDDPELRLMKGSYRAEFKKAFAAALAGLSPEERNILRLHLVDQLNIDRIAALLGTHRATAARRVARSRERVVDEVRTQLTRTLTLDSTELRDALALARSQLDLSLTRLLRPSPKTL